MPAEYPQPSERMPLTVVAAPHPAVLSVEQLLRQCETRNQPRSGPGGQHRNRTSSGVFLTYRPSEITAEATEQRSQHRNRDTAITRLRFLLATSLRTPSPLQETDAVDEQEHAIRQKYTGSPLRLADTNVDKPAMLAMLLNDCWVAGGQPSLVSSHWKSSTSRVVALLKTHHPALQLVNQFRSYHDRPPLR